MTTILLPCIVQLDYKDNLFETIVNLLDFYSLNLRGISSGGLGWSSHTVILFILHDKVNQVKRKRGDRERGARSSSWDMSCPPKLLLVFVLEEVCLPRSPHAGQPRSDV